MSFEDFDDFNGKDAFEALDEFLEGGGGPKGISWKDAKVGNSITGIIYDAEMRDKLDPKTKAVVLNAYGKPKKVMVLHLLTDLRDPEIEGDDGKRRAFLQGNALFEFRKYLKDNDLKVRKGGRFKQTLIGTKPTEHFNPQNLFQCLYAAPTQESLGAANQATNTAAPAAGDPWTGDSAPATQAAPTNTLEAMRNAGRNGSSSGPIPF